MVDGIAKPESDSCDAYRCRWPACNCYHPQGPQECQRQAAGLQRVFRTVTAGQEPLGEDFEKVWDDNTDRLYQR